MKKIMCGIVVVLLSGCATIKSDYQRFKKSGDYAMNASSVNPVNVPPGLSDKNINSYYPVPNVPRADDTRTVSIIPPGSQLSQATTSVTKPAVSPAVTVPIAKVNALQLSQPPEKVWTQVGQAIVKAGYQLLDQDNMLHTYYILDVKATAGKIQHDTPIYQLSLQANATGTQLTLLTAQNQTPDTAVQQRILTDLQAQLK